MSDKLVPLGDHVIVKPHRETTTSAGIVIPDTAISEKTDRGEVISVGPGRVQEDGTRSPMDVAVGDKVIFAKYAADELEVDGEKLLILSASDCKATIQSA